MVRPTLFVADLVQLSFPQMVQMIGAIRSRASTRKVAAVPIILENHTKDILDFDRFEKFAEYVCGASDLEVVTLTQVHQGLLSGLYQPVSRR